MAEFHMKDVKAALENASKQPSMTNKTAQSKKTPPIQILLWNIHDSSLTGMAGARQMLLRKVLEQASPEIILLQEIKTDKIIEAVQGHSPPGRMYDNCKSQDKSEARIMYDQNCFEFCSIVDIEQTIGNSKLTKIAPSDRSSRQVQSGEKRLYKDRVCAIKLRSKQTSKEFVLMSFHNISKRSAPRVVVESYAQGFIRLVSLVHTAEKIPVIAGADFNCDRSKLTSTAATEECKIPDYTSSVRRRTDEKIDLYVIKGINIYDVHVFEVLPLADHTDASAGTHPLSIGALRELVDKAPIKKDGKQVTRLEYNAVSNHDPILSTLKITP